MTAPAFAHAALRDGSKSFALAAKVLPQALRDDVAVLYAYCRRADDTVDEAPAEQRKLLVERLSAELSSIYAGEPQQEPVLAAFQRLVQRCAIPEEYPRLLLDGMRWDSGRVRLRTVDELIAYSERVAGVVGLMFCRLVGVADPAALRPASDLGIAMQITNVCRDVREDWERQRLYVPEEVLAAVGAPELGADFRESLRPHARELAAATDRLLDLADGYYQSADRGIQRLPWRVALAVRTARHVYAAIGQGLRERGCDVLSGRVVVPLWKKLLLALRAAGQELTERLSALARASELFVYLGRVREFTRKDWLVYVAWVGLMIGLVLATGGFVAVGHVTGAPLPPEAYLVPAGALVFTLAIAVDTVGHRTIYKQEIQAAEGLVHGITILCGIGSCVLLTAAYTWPGFVAIPAMVLTVLSFVYSLIDEMFHWRRYVSQRSDRVEMWSHVGIFVGHLTMMLAWWAWFFEDYAGVSEVVATLRHG